MAAYEYPDELYCEQCGNDVAPVLRRAERELTHEDGHTLTVRYMEAVCPRCGHVLCDRDYYCAVAEAVRGD